MKALGMKGFWAAAMGLVIGVWRLSVGGVHFVNLMANPPVTDSAVTMRGA